MRMSLRMSTMRVSIRRMLPLKHPPISPLLLLLRINRRQLRISRRHLYRARVRQRHTMLARLLLRRCVRLEVAGLSWVGAMRSANGEGAGVGIQWRALVEELLLVGRAAGRHGRGGDGGHWGVRVWGRVRVRVGVGMAVGGDGGVAEGVVRRRWGRVRSTRRMGDALVGREDCADWLS